MLGKHAQALINNQRGNNEALIGDISQVVFQHLINSSLWV